MSRLMILMILSCSNILIAGNHCGSKEGYFNKLASKYLIPDYFPAKSTIIQRLFGKRLESKSCLMRYGRAPIHIACSQHDRCYETKGASKGNCDRNLLQGWLRVCQSKYSPSGSLLERLSLDSCLSLCSHFVDLMSKAQRFNKFGICPSCKAFEKAQKKALAPRDE